MKYVVVMLVLMTAACSSEATTSEPPEDAGSHPEAAPDPWACFKMICPKDASAD